MDNYVKWNFPYNGGGQIRGVADAGIETFNGSVLESLARETCQNSLDALSNTSNVVNVEFKNYVIETKKIPGYEEIKCTFEKLYNYWKDSSDKAREFLKKGLDTLNSSQINILRISDFHTTGLLGPYDTSLKSVWNSMTKIDGGGNKSNDKNGGFGIGKNAPYANSLLRTVFYRTYTENKEIAAQGIARLLSYPEDINYELDTMTTGFGYYGDSNHNTPIDRIIELDNINERKEYGTDLFILGFNKDISKDWEKDIIIELLNNFIVSIYYGKLVVKVDKVVLSRDTLEDLIKEYIKPNKKPASKTCYSNYQVLTSPDTKVFEKEFHGLGTLRLSVLIDPNLDLDKKVLRTRKSGMKLFAKNNISKAISFSGILELEGVKLKEYFKELEPPTHDKWEPDRHISDPYEAKSYLEEITKWEQDEIWKLGETSNAEEIDVEGLSDILSSNEDAGNHQDIEPHETIDYKLGEIHIIERPRKTISHGNFNGNHGQNKGGKKEKKPGHIDDGGSETGIRTLKGTKPRTKKTKHKAVEDPKGKDIVVVDKNNHNDCPLDKLRIFKIGRNMYKASFIIPYTIKEGHIEICSIGENNKVNKMKLLSGREISNCADLKVINNNLVFSNIIGETKVAIQFELMDNQNYAMEVNVYEH